MPDRARLILRARLAILIARRHHGWLVLFGVVLLAVAAQRPEARGAGQVSAVGAGVPWWAVGAAMWAGIVPTVVEPFGGWRERRAAVRSGRACMGLLGVVGVPMGVGLAGFDHGSIERSSCAWALVFVALGAGLALTRWSFAGWLVAPYVLASSLLGEIPPMMGDHERWTSMASTVLASGSAVAVSLVGAVVGARRGRFGPSPF